MQEKFGLMNSTDSAARMRAVFQFMEFWLGKRQPSFGEDREKLAAVALPQPLRDLYEFAGRWPGPTGELVDYAIPALSYGHRFLAVDHLRFDEDSNRVEFFEENQDVWLCSTLTEGEDPPLWCRDDNDPQTPVCQSLSTFLASLVLQACLFNSCLVLTQKSTNKTSLQQMFEADSPIPLWRSGPEVCPAPQLMDIYLWQNCLVYVEQAGTLTFRTLAANHDNGLKFLADNSRDEYFS